MNEDKLKNMWKGAENRLGAPGYESETIEKFLSSRSGSVAVKIARLLQFDIALKLLTVVALIVNAVLYFNVQTEVFYTCISGIILLVSLVWYELTVLKRFHSVSDYSKSTKEKLSAMLTFLQSRFFSVLLSVSSTYLFFFIAGSLIYFYSAYGQVRPLDNTDVFVFTILCFIGIVINFSANWGQVNYFKKHLKVCLSDMNDSILSIVTSNIETQQKQDRTTKLLLALVLVFGFVILVAVLKKFGI
jgi:hypothetical protein